MKYCKIEHTIGFFNLEIKNKISEKEIDCIFFCMFVNTKFLTN